MFIKKIIWRIAPYLGTSPARWAWDDQFANGRWDYLKHRDKAVAELVADRAGCGTVIDLGCGEGNLAFELPRGSYSRYVGVDVSRVAATNAAQRALREGNSLCEFFCTDLREWQSDENASVVLIEEVLYYLSPAAQHTLLDTCERSLSRDGSLVILIHDRKQHPVTTALLTKRYGEQYRVSLGTNRFCMVVPASVRESELALSDAV